MRFEIKHPTEQRVFAIYGFDHALGYFVEVKRPGQHKAEYDQLHPGYKDLDGALSFLVTQGFFGSDALIDAKVWLQDEGGESNASDEVRRAAIVICQLKEWDLPRASGELRVDNWLKCNQVRFGPNILFHSDEDRVANRKDFTDPQCLARFDSVWKNILHAAVQAADQITAEDACEDLNPRQKEYFDASASHREFWLKGMKFVAQIAGNKLTQLWGIRSRDKNPKALFVRFETVEERQHFDIVAQSLNWDAETLALKLIRDFVDTVKRIK